MNTPELHRHIPLLLLLLLPAALLAQDTSLTLNGWVTCEGKGVPYATLQLLGTSTGVACNNSGEYELKVPPGHEQDTIVIRSIGYLQVRRTVNDLKKRGNVRLERQFIVLKEVKVSDFRTAEGLIAAAVNRIGQNYHNQTAYSTFFYRDWRALNGELYLLDEAVMRFRREGYSQFKDKEGYTYCDCRRELESDYKSLLKHRLVVFDRKMLEKVVHKQLGVYERVEYADNAVFFDPVATPQACYMLATRILGSHDFEPIFEFEADGEHYYRVRSVGPGRLSGSKVHYEYLIRKKDLAILRITSSQEPVAQHAPQDAWANVYFTRMTMDSDTSAWTYDVRDGHYTLQHYYNNKVYRLSSKGRGHDKEVQRWQQCVDWTLTDFTLIPPAQEGTLLDVKPLSLPTAFGKSDQITSSFWEDYNTIPIDPLPLRMLIDKLKNNKQ